MPGWRRGRGLGLSGFVGLARFGCALASLVLFAGAAWADACASTGGEPVHVASVEQRLELRLADGRLIRLVGLDPALQTPDAPDLGETSRAALAEMLKDRAVTIQVVSNAPDRWGRVAAWAFVAGDAKTGEIGKAVATAAIAVGLGRYRAEPAAHACRDNLVAAEDAARRARLGLWADPYYAVLAVDDRSAFAERSGTIVLVEGRLTAVSPGPYRTKLRFAARDPVSYGGHVFSATILPRVMKSFEAKHVILSSLIGRTLRVRGLLDLRFGPQIELAGPDDMDVVAPSSDHAVSSDHAAPEAATLSRSN